MQCHNILDYCNSDEGWQWTLPRDVALTHVIKWHGISCHAMPCRPTINRCTHVRECLVIPCHAVEKVAEGFDQRLLNEDCNQRIAPGPAIRQPPIPPQRVMIRRNRQATEHQRRAGNRERRETRCASAATEPRSGTARGAELVLAARTPAQRAISRCLRVVNSRVQNLQIACIDLQRARHHLLTGEICERLRHLVQKCKLGDDLIFI